MLPAAWRPAVASAAGNSTAITTRRSSMPPIPLVFNAIPDLGTARPDFLDRALIVEFLSIKPETRRDEAQFWREFSERRPRILGALLDAAVAGLRNLPQVKLDRLLRLADFALWVSACEEALGMKPGEAMAACRANCAEARELALDASPLYGPLAELAREGVTGTVAELHARLDSMVSDALRRSVHWPKAPNGLVMLLGAWPPISAPRCGASVQPQRCAGQASGLRGRCGADSENTVSCCQ